MSSSSAGAKRGERSKRGRVVLVGAFRRIVPEGGDSPFGSQGGFVDTLSPDPYSLATAKLKAFSEADPDISRRWRIDLLNLAEPLELEDEREEVRLDEKDYRAILELEPDVIGFSAFCWNIDAFATAAVELKARRPGITIIMGGRAVEGEPEAMLERMPAVDALVVGEGELSLREILRREDGKLDGIPGVVWRRDGRVVSGGPPWCVPDLDEVPSPYLAGVVKPPLHGVMLELTRGCLNSCGYCTWSADRRLRWSGAGRIEAEVRWAREQGHRHVTVTDSAINYDTAKLTELVDAIQRADPEGEVQFTYNIRYDRLDEAQLAVLARLPTHMVLLGVESLQAGAFTEVDRTPSKAEIVEAKLRDLARAVRPPVVSIILGLPGDTEEGFRQTLETLLEWARIDTEGGATIGAVLVSLLQVYAGSGLWARRDELGLRFKEQGIPYLIEGPGWSVDSLGRAKDLLIRSMGEHPEVLKAAEAIVMTEAQGTLDPWLTRRRLTIVLQGWPLAATMDGWTFEQLGLLRDTGQAVSLRFRWRDGGGARILLSRRVDGPRRGDDTRLYSVTSRPIPGSPPPAEAVAHLESLVRELLLEGEERVANAVARRRVIMVD